MIDNIYKLFGGEAIEKRQESGSNTGRFESNIWLSGQGNIKEKHGKREQIKNWEKISKKYMNKKCNECGRLLLSMYRFLLCFLVGSVRVRGNRR